MKNKIPYIVIFLLLTTLLVGCSKNEKLVYEPRNNTNFQKILFEEGLNINEYLKTIEDEYKDIEKMSLIDDDTREEMIEELENKNLALDVLYKEEEKYVNNETFIVYKELKLIHYNQINMLYTSKVSHLKDKKLTEDKIENYNSFLESIMTTFDRIKEPLRFMYIQTYYPHIQIESVSDLEWKEYNKFKGFLNNANGLLYSHRKSNEYMIGLNKLVNKTYKDEKEYNEILFNLEHYSESMKEVSGLYLSNQYFTDFVDYIEINNIFKDNKEKLKEEDIISYRDSLNKKYFADGENKIFTILFQE